MPVCVATDRGERLVRVATPEAGVERRASSSAILRLPPSMCTSTAPGYLADRRTRSDVAAMGEYRPRPRARQNATRRTHGGTSRSNAESEYRVLKWRLDPDPLLDDPTHWLLVIDLRPGAVCVCAPFL